MVGKRKFGGEVFVHYSTWDSNWDASQDCRRLRWKGYKARVVECAEGFKCYRGSKRKRKVN